MTYQIGFDLPKHKYIDISGRRFGRLVAIAPTERRGKHREIFWLCICDCGKEAVIRSRSLVAGETKSCGCWAKYITAERSKIEENLASFNNLMYKYKETARHNEIEFSLSKEEFKVLTKGNCFYCGIEPRQVRRNRLHLNGEYVHNGIDRVDSSKGYVLENCVPCCKVCNYAKRNMTYVEFLNWIKSAYQHNFGDSTDGK